jgi:hypothetical protein
LVRNQRVDGFTFVVLFVGTDQHVDQISLEEMFVAWVGVEPDLPCGSIILLPWLDFESLWRLIPWPLG